MDKDKDNEVKGTPTTLKALEEKRESQTEAPNTSENTSKMKKLETADEIVQDEP